eukprot:1182546-Prorocentrum_minimum.AAC.8
MATARIAAIICTKPENFKNQFTNSVRKVSAWSVSAPTSKKNILGSSRLTSRVGRATAPRPVHHNFGGAIKRSYRRATSIINAAGEGCMFDTELARGHEAVRLASQLCQKVQRQLSGDDEQAKTDDSPVTVADYGASGVRSRERRTFLPAHLRGAIEVSLTRACVRSAPDLGNSPGGAEGRHWVLDPIDGTRGFVGGRQYAVCLGMIQDGEDGSPGQVVVGVLGCPNMPAALMTAEDGTAAASKVIGAKGIGMCFIAQKGGGAFKGLLADGVPTERLKMEDTSDCTKGRWMESYESRHSSHGTTAALVSSLLLLDPAVYSSLRGWGIALHKTLTCEAHNPPPRFRLILRCTPAVSNSVVVSRTG